MSIEARRVQGERERIAYVPGIFGVSESDEAFGAQHRPRMLCLICADERVLTISVDSASIRPGGQEAYRKQGVVVGEVLLTYLASDSRGDRRLYQIVSRSVLHSRLRTYHERRSPTCVLQR